jgi:choline dehydrogenase-like flavoprotein
MKPARAHPFNCGAKCMLGCRCGAKWNAAEYVDEAVAAGAVLETQARVERVIIEQGRCEGVAGRLRGLPFEARAKTVVVAAGGIGTPRILQASGFEQAGQGMTMDITVMVYGIGNGPGIGKEPPMTWSWENLEDGYMLSTLADPWLLFPLIMALKGPRYPLYWPKWNRLLGVMIKLKDDVSGGVFTNGKISKPMTPNDSRRMAAAQLLCGRILTQAGADPDAIFVSPQRGTHPSGTVRIGTMLDRDLQTSTPGLYVCDASVFPEALARPTVLTIIGLAKRLAKHLTKNALI